MRLRLEWLPVENKLFGNETTAQLITNRENYDYICDYDHYYAATECIPPLSFLKECGIIDSDGNVCSYKQSHNALRRNSSGQMTIGIHTSCICNYCGCRLDLAYASCTTSSPAECDCLAQWSPVALPPARNSS